MADKGSRRAPFLRALGLNFLFQIATFKPNRPPQCRSLQKSCFTNLSLCAKIRLNLKYEGPNMKNVYDVLRQKEQELQQLQREVEALRLAARLLNDDNEMAAPLPLVPRMASGAAAEAVPMPPPRPAAELPKAEKGGYSAAWDNAPKQFP
jgi:hypothetical protein